MHAARRKPVKPVLPRLPTRMNSAVVAKLRQYILELLIGSGFTGSQISGGWMRLAHPFGVQAWLGRQYLRLFTFEGGRRVDIGWYTVFDAETIKPILRRCVTEMSKNVKLFDTWAG